MNSLATSYDTYIIWYLSIFATYLPRPERHHDGGNRKGLPSRDHDEIGAKSKKRGK